MNSPPLSESSPSSGKGNRRRISANSSNTAASPLLRTPRQSIQPVATSTVLKVEWNCPALVDPQWATRSISRNPGRASFQSAKVLIGTWLRNSEPGRVRDRPRPLGSARYGASRRLIVAGLICATRATSSGSRSDSSPQARSLPSRSDRNGASRLTTHIVGDLPARAQQRHFLGPVHRRTSVAWRQRSARERPTQQLDGVLPVIPSRCAELVQDPALLLAAGPLIPHRHRRGVVVPGLSLHLTGPPFGQIFSEPVGQIRSPETRARALSD